VGDAAERTAGVVLAAGTGSRFLAAVPKLLWPFRGRPLVAWVLDAVLAADLDGVAVVTGAVDLSSLLDGLDGRVVVAENPCWVDGQASSLRRGLEWCHAAGFDAAVVGLGDQPLVPASAWRTVGRARESPIATATYRGRRRPPVRLHRTVWPLVSGTGDEGARELMRRRPDLVREVACEGDPVDVDTVEDLRRLDEIAADVVPRATESAEEVPGTEER
jgi:molybdenum cofactor cytidylyltransferase